MELLEQDVSINDALGNPVWCRYQSTILRDDDNIAYHHVGRLLDIHDLVMMSRKYEETARKDSLTGLYNRRAAIEKINALLKNNLAGKYMMFIVDVDNFKEINDTYGHPEGDKALVYLADGLRKMFRQTDVIARIGGDEFLIFLPRVDNCRIVTKRMEDFCHFAFKDYVTESGKRTGFSFSMGGISDTNTDTSFALLYRRADKALYEAKHNGKNTIYFEDSI